MQFGYAIRDDWLEGADSFDDSILTLAKYLSSPDLAAGYHQVEMTAKDRETTAFTTPFGFYEWKRLPFGLANPPAHFSWFMQKVMSDHLFQILIIYFDDLVDTSLPPSLFPAWCRAAEVEVFERSDVRAAQAGCHVLASVVRFLTGRKVSSPFEEQTRVTAQ
ncbi:hypothetical protein RRG08_056756 [Elysia crispata]|uniref:Reverse transcriptase domain-containing protein n=1 Tax=Elysia crispata TaxID=231223 RepID=A0AAE1DLA4_9GAST|nr:hypothetical protein RRG08_056756 [Elysia crispata]